MRIVIAVVSMVMLVGVAGAVDFSFDEQPGQLVLKGDGKVWASTMITPFDAAQKDQTYKVYTHVYDFAGKAPITKGPGGKYPHHRGLFIGWKKVTAGGKTYNIWEMSDSFQAHNVWVKTEAGAEKAVQVEKVAWNTEAGKTLMDETRTITVTPGLDGARVFDFESTLSSRAGTINLRGDAHHGGMQLRMEQEVVDHPESTHYIFPEGAKQEENDTVSNAWWVCCSSVVRDKRYWVLHMTPKTHPTGMPLYSVRPYARFGAFFETDLQEGKPLTVKFRILVSEKELNTAACEALYAAYSQDEK